MADHQSFNPEEYEQASDRLIDVAVAGLSALDRGRWALVRNLISLSAGSMVVTVSVVGLFLADDPDWLWLLPAAWLFLGASVITGLLYVIKATGPDVMALTLRKKFDDYSVDLKEFMLDRELPMEALAAIVLKQAIERVDESFDTTPTILLASSLLLFSAGLLALGLFASINLPW